MIQVEPSLSLEMKIYRTLGEVPFARSLAGFTFVTMEGWRDQLIVSNHEMCIKNTQLRAEFRYL